MRRAVVHLVVSHCLLCAAVLALRAGGEGEAEAIIAKTIKAHFPKGLDMKNKALRMKSKGTLHIMGLDLDYAQEVAIHMPNKFRESMEMNVMNQNVAVTSVYNGKDAWIVANGKEVPINDDIRNEFKEAAENMAIMQGLFLKDKSLKFSLVGDMKVKGKDAVGVIVSREGKKDITLYLDKATGLMAKVELRKRDLMTGQEVTEERFITEYQDAQGRKVAKKVEVLRDGKPFIEAEVQEVQILPKIDDSEFTQPK
jgi:outer membrane lipoprotein-sorting protein